MKKKKDPSKNLTNAQRQQRIRERRAAEGKVAILSIEVLKEHAAGAREAGRKAIRKYVKSKQEAE